MTNLPDRLKEALADRYVLERESGNPLAWTSVPQGGW